MPGTRTQAEVDVLLALLSGNPDFNILRDPEIWLAIQRAAGRHGMAPLLAYAIRAHVPDEKRAWCDRVLAESCDSWRRNLRELEFVADTLGRRGIRVLALKGPLLASRHYDPPFLRMPSGDLDLGVRDSEIDQACAVLRDVGYYLESPIETARKFSHHVVLLHPERTGVELHFRLSHGPFGPAIDPFLANAVPHRLENGAEVFILEGATEILHLALHVVCGRFRPFFHLYELRRISTAAGAGTLRETAAMAAQLRFAGVFALLDAAFQSCWHEPFLPADVAMPRTWLSWRINEELYRKYCRWSDLGPARSMRSRLTGRWLDFQTMDHPSHACRQIAMLARCAWYQLLTQHQK